MFIVAIVFKDEDNFVHAPADGKSKALVLVISSSIATADTLKQYLIDRNYSVAGPFNTVDAGNMFLRKSTRVDAIIFDANTDNEEMNSLISLIQNELDSTPLIIISNINLQIKYDNMSQIQSPVDLTILNKELELMTGTSDLVPYAEFVEFINAIFAKIVTLTPTSYKIKVTETLESVTSNLAFRNSNYLRRSNENLSLVVTDYSHMNFSELSIMVLNSLDELIEELETKVNISGVRSLINDAIESTLLNLNITPEIVEFSEKFGINMEHFEYSVASITDRATREVSVFNISLADDGPIMKDKIATTQELRDAFHPNMASQILVLVGQGSSYHQGIFGPIPVPSKIDVTAIICSRLINSDIKDARMKGKSLNVIAIGFKRDLINCIPNRTKLEEIFQPFYEIDGEGEINISILTKIQNNFLVNLTC